MSFRHDSRASLLSIQALLFSRCRLARLVASRYHAGLLSSARARRMLHAGYGKKQDGRVKHVIDDGDKLKFRLVYARVMPGFFMIFQYLLLQPARFRKPPRHHQYGRDLPPAA